MGTWRFEQITGRGDDDVIELSGWAAPFGRPRQGAVVSDGIEVRQALTYYAGRDGAPTRHIFGLKYDPFHLHGRFRDRAGGKGFAKAITEKMKQFVAQQRQVRVSWGDIIDVQGLITKFDPDREGVEEVAWSMEIDVDVDNLADKIVRAPVAQTPSDYASTLRSLMKLKLLAETDLSNLTGEFLEAFEQLSGPIDKAMKELDDALLAISGFQGAVFNSLDHIASLVARAHTVWEHFTATVTNIEVGTVMVSQTASDGLATWGLQTRMENIGRQVLATLAAVEVATARARAGAQSKLVVAKGGDTWDSLAIAAYGDASKAAQIQKANNGAPGSAPVAGNAYIIP